MAHWRRIGGHVMALNLASLRTALLLSASEQRALAPMIICEVVPIFEQMSTAQAMVVAL